MNKDRKILAKYKLQDPWGLYTSIDLKNCDVSLIRDEDVIKDFIDKLCKLINVKKYGETIIVDFGENDRVTGFSVMQLIETSVISAHLGNQYNGAFVFLDIFSCKQYKPYMAAEFTKKFFKGKKMRVKVNLRY